MALSVSAASRTVRVIGPGVSWLWLIGITWVRDTSPTVGFSPTMPFTAAGQVTDPSVSVPMAMSTMPAATAAPEPDEEPEAEPHPLGDALPPPIKAKLAPGKDPELLKLLIDAYESVKRDERGYVSLSAMGQLAGNHFLSITAGLGRLAEIGRDTLWTGAKTIRIRLTPGPGGAGTLVA